MDFEAGAYGVIRERAASTSHGAARATGRGRPDVAHANAFDTSAGACVGCSMFSAYFVKVRNVASWSGIS